MISAWWEIARWIWLAARYRFAAIVVSLLLVVVQLTVAIVVFRVGKCSGAREERVRATADAISAKAAAESSYRRKELENAQRIQEIRAEYAGKDSRELAGDTVVAGDLRSGKRELRFKAARCPVAAVAGPAPRGTDAPEEIRLAPEVAETLWSIASDGDAAIRQLTALQAWARSAVLLCSGNSPRVP